MAAKARKASPKKRPASGRKQVRHSRFGISFFSLSAGAVMALLAFAALFSYFILPLITRPTREPEYFKNYNIRGIDVSHYQRIIDWEALRNARLNGFPIRFVIIKASEGSDHTDRRFRDNFVKARRYGFVRGAYHFFNPSSSPTLQAKHFFRQVQLESGDLPPILDVEERGSKPLEEFQEDVLAWLDYAEKKSGATPILYASYSFRMKFLKDPRFDAYPFWVAHYNMRKLRYRGEWVMWQYTEDGRIDGIEDDVDLNLFNGEFADLQRLLIP